MSFFLGRLSSKLGSVEPVKAGESILRGWFGLPPNVTVCLFGLLLNERLSIDC